MRMQNKIDFARNHFCISLQSGCGVRYVNTENMPSNIDLQYFSHSFYVDSKFTLAGNQSLFYTAREINIVGK